MDKYINRLSFRIGSLIIITEIVVLLGLGIFYTARFTGDLNTRFEYQVKAPGLLMSKGLLKYETVRDKAIMESIVSDSITDCMVIGANSKVYYSMTKEYEGKKLDDLKNIYKFQEFGKELNTAVIIKVSDANGEYVVSLSPLRFQDGRFLGYLYSKINTVNLNYTKNKLIVIFIFGTLLCVILSSIVILYLFNKFISVTIVR